MLRGTVANHLSRNKRKHSAVETMQALNAVRANVVADDNIIEVSEGKSVRGFRYVRAEGKTSDRPWTIDIYPNNYFRVRISGLEAQTISGIHSLVWLLRWQLQRV